MPIIAGVELGGTKSIATLGALSPDATDQPPQIVDQLRVPTTHPDETLGALAQVLARWRTSHAPEALGIGSFGPINLRAGDKDFGHLLTTPKPGWAGVNLVERLAPALGVPVALHTDVTAAALAEGRWGGARGCTDYGYLTIGTGVGLGMVAGGKPVTGMLHPEAGHMRVRRIAGDDFAGTCPVHGDCLEGLVAGPALQARFGQPSHDVPPDDPRWLPVIDALGEGLAILLLTFAPQKLLIGGGVGVGQPELIARAALSAVDKINGYLPELNHNSISSVIHSATLADQAGPLGTLALATTAIR